MDLQSYREVLGQRLQDFRESRGISRYAIAQKGRIRVEQVKSVEEGITSYTVDTFLGYLIGSDLYVYFAEKSEDDSSPDLKSLVDKAIERDPKL